MDFRLIFRLFFSTTFFFFFLWVCMLNSEKLQRVLKLINYKMLYLLWFSPCVICVCMHMWCTHILSSHACWSTQSKIFHSFPILAREFQIYRVVVVFFMFFCIAHRNWHHDVFLAVRTLMMKKNETTNESNERMNEWKLGTEKIAYRDYGGV